MNQAQLAEKIDDHKANCPRAAVEGRLRLLAQVGNAVGVFVMGRGLLLVSGCGKSVSEAENCVLLCSGDSRKLVYLTRNDDHDLSLFRCSLDEKDKVDWIRDFDFTTYAGMKCESVGFCNTNGPWNSLKGEVMSVAVTSIKAKFEVNSANVEIVQGAPLWDGTILLGVRSSGVLDCFVSSTALHYWLKGLVLSIEEIAQYFPFQAKLAKTLEEKRTRKRRQVEQLYDQA
jgi:hypothetical protein